MWEQHAKLCCWVCQAHFPGSNKHATTSRTDPLLCRVYALEAWPSLSCCPPTNVIRYMVVNLWSDLALVFDRLCCSTLTQYPADLDAMTVDYPVVMPITDRMRSLCVLVFVVLAANALAREAPAGDVKKFGETHTGSAAGVVKPASGTQGKDSKIGECGTSRDSLLLSAEKLTLKDVMQHQY